MRVSARLISTAILGLYLAVFAAHVTGQVDLAGAIRGTVLDVNGTAVRGLTVTVTRSNTTLARSATSDGKGHFSITNLPPGRYVVTIKAARGFTAFEAGQVKIGVSTTSTTHPFIFRVSERGRSNDRALEETARSETAKMAPPRAPSLTALSASSDKTNPVSATVNTPSEHDFLAVLSAPASKNEAPPIARGAAAPATVNSAALLTNVYRVGPNDVLDVRLLNSPISQSTLYTITEDGLLDHPLVSSRLAVAGLTVEQISARLASEFKRRAVDANPQVVVSVREYTSHTVIVSGLVNDPGTKVLRREAIPLYVVVAYAQPRPEAERAAIMSHTTGQRTVIDLSDEEAMNSLVRPGDVVTLEARPPQFFYIGGEINEPGEKLFRAGMTLTQAILTAGGASRPESSLVEVARQNDDGLLTISRYNLKDIKSGKIPDPRLQPGDRIEVNRR